MKYFSIFSFCILLTSAQYIASMNAGARTPNDVKHAGPSTDSSTQTNRRHIKA